MPKNPSSLFKVYKHERSNSIQSNKHGAVKATVKDFQRTSTKTNTAKCRQSSITPSKCRNKKKQGLDQKGESKMSETNINVKNRDGFTMTKSLVIPRLSPRNRSGFTRKNSLQFTTNFGDQSNQINPLSQLLNRTQLTLQRYKLTTQRLTSKNKDLSRKLALADHQITLLQRQIRRSKEL